MRIAVLAPTPPWVVRSGLETVAFESAKNLAKRGHEVDFICLNHGRRDEIVDGVNVIYAGKKLETGFMPMNHLLNSVTHFLTSHKGVKKRYDVFYAHKGIFLPMAKGGTPSVKYSYGEFLHWSPVTTANILIDLFDSIASERIIACSEYAKSQLKWFGFKHIDVITPGTYVDIFKPGLKVDALRKKYGNGFNIIFAGRVTPSKGCTQLIDILSMVKSDFRMIFVGKYERKYADFLMKKAKSYGIENKLVFLGETGYYNIPKYYNMADVQVLPSPIEAFGMVNVEAQSCGVPSIAYDVGGVGSSISHKRTGFLVAPGNKREFAERINFLLENEKERRRMGRRARTWAKENFDWSVIAKRVEKVFKRL